MEISDISDELLRKAAAGDMNAFETIYRASSGFVYNVALRVTGSAEDAEEGVQDVFLKVFESLSGFGFRSSFKTWIYRVTVNTALNMLKRSSSRAGRMVEYDENVAEANSARDDSVEKSVQTKSDVETVNALLKTLSPDYRTCIVLRELQGLSYEDIANTLEININTVRTRLKRAREILIKNSGKENILTRETAAKK